MKRKAVILGLALVVGLFLAVWLAVNVAINSGPGKRVLAGKVAGMVGAPLEFERAWMMPWGTLRLIEPRMKVPAKGDEEEAESGPDSELEPDPFFKSKEVRIRFAPLSVFGKNVRVREITLADPVITVVREKSGALRVPAIFQPPRPAAPRAGGQGVMEPEEALRGSQGVPVSTMASATGAGEVAATVAGGSADAADGEVTASGAGSPEASGGTGEAPGAGIVTGGGKGESKPAPPVKREPMPAVIGVGARALHLGDVVIEQGVFSVVSFDRKPLVEVADVELRLNMSHTPDQEGTFSASGASLFGKMRLENLRARVFTDGFTFVLSELVAGIDDGGEFEGRIEANPLVPGLPFIVLMNCKGVPLRMADELLMNRAAFSSGEVEGGIQMIGLLRAPATYRGKGALQVRGARLENKGGPNPLKREGAVQPIEAIEFDDMTLKFAVLQGQVLVEELAASMEDIALSARGYVNFAGALNLAARFYISERVFNAVKAMEDQLPPEQRFGFQAFPGSSRFYRDYLVQGTPADPTIDFWGDRSRVRASELQKFFGWARDQEGGSR